MSSLEDMFGYRMEMEVELFEKTALDSYIPNKTDVKLTKYENIIDVRDHPYIVKYKIENKSFIIDDVQATSCRGNSVICIFSLIPYIVDTYDYQVAVKKELFSSYFNMYHHKKYFQYSYFTYEDDNYYYYGHDNEKFNEDEFREIGLI